MKIAVGSDNPVKVTAVKKAFLKVWPKKNCLVTGLVTDSGVSNQPMSDEESIKGAQNRARQALGKAKADFGVGLESGLQKIGRHWFCCGWVVVIDKYGNIGTAASVRIEMPKKIMILIDQGVELGQAADKFFERKNVKQKEGFFGLMTNNIISRTDAYIDGVVMALVRFIKTELFAD